MNTEFWVLMATALSVGAIHTILGPDHYVPLIALARAHKWSRPMAIFITTVGGIAHVLSSIIIAVVGVFLGRTIFDIKTIESYRNDIAVWLLLIFGFTYLVYGIYVAIRNKPHEHAHIHEGGESHTHLHSHQDSHSHVHKLKSNLWILFLLFALGPCEPLIPIVMYPAARGNVLEALAVSLVFSTVTVIIMLGVVSSALFGLSKLPTTKFERYSHLIAGCVIFLTGIGIKFLGL